MNEQSAIISAFESLCGEGKPAALATVVAVSGSAYRRPGARMLIAEDGRTWGGISGGCLERDVVRRSRGVLASGRPVTCRYETTDDEDMASGVATGCRGTLDLFIEPLSRDAPGPIPWLIQASRGRRPVGVATVVRSTTPDTPQGVRLSLDESVEAGRIEGPALRTFCMRALSDAADGLAKLVRFHGVGARVDVFIERLMPPQALVIFGAGPDAVPVVSIAKMMGWHVSVVGVRPATGLAQRFSHADLLHVTPADDPMAGVEVTKDSAVVLMTHNYPRDIGILAGLPVTPRYLGILGPRSRTEQLFADLRRRLRTPPGIHSANRSIPVWQNAFAPVGLDLGAETPEEIALSIVAEIQTVLRGAPAGYLRDRNGPIHAMQDGEQSPPNWIVSERVWREVACPM